MQNWASYMDGMGGFESRGSGNFFPEGFSGVLVLEKMYGQNSQQGGQLQVLSELRVIEANLPQCPPGSSWTYILDFRHQSTKANYQAYLAVLCGIDPQDKAKIQQTINPQSAMAVLQGNPMRGRIVGLETSVGKMTQGRNGKPPHPITYHNWRVVDQPAYAQRAQEILSRPIAAAAPAAMMAPPSAPGFPGAAPSFPGGVSGGAPAFPFTQQAPAAPASMALPFLGSAPAQAPASPPSAALPFLGGQSSTPAAAPAGGLPFLGGAPAAAPPPPPPPSLPTPPEAPWTTHPQHPTKQYRQKADGSYEWRDI